jgi:zinc resistance-associated protein
LTPAQEKNWAGLESALRDAAKARAARMAEWRQKAKEGHEHHDYVDGLREKAKALATRAKE